MNAVGQNVVTELLISTSYKQEKPVVPTSAEVETFMLAAVQLGSEFLACGGPVTRLETQLTLAGEKHGYDTTVHATPSAINIYCHVSKLNETFCRSRRIKNFGVDLGRLQFVDHLLTQFGEGDCHSSQIIERLIKLNLDAKQMAISTHLISIFGIGAGAAILNGADLFYALECGLFTLLARVVISLVNKISPMNAIFSDFVTCLIVFVGSILASHFLKVSPYLLSLGTLVYIVPGLLMTTAISEIVDQNYLSGTIRLLKAVFTFMAMALAYYMAIDLGKSLNFDFQNYTTIIGSSPAFHVRFVGAALIILFSSLEFRAPRSALLWILVCGLSGMLCYSLTYADGDLVKPAFFASFTMGLISYRLSRFYQLPSQIYSVPSILILVPGMLAFSGFGYGASSNLDMSTIIRAGLISLSIVFGLAVGRLRL